MKRLIGAALVLTLILSVAPVLASDALHALRQLSPEVRATVTLLTDEQLAAVEGEGERFLLFLTTMCSQCRSWSRTWEYRDWPVNTREEYGEQYPAASSAAVAAWIHERNPDLRASHVQTWPQKPRPPVQEVGEAGEVRGGQSPGRARGGAIPQRVSASLAGPCHPLAHGRRASFQF